MALRSRQIHFGDALFQRATEKLYTEDVVLVEAGLAVAKALGAAVLALVVAPDAVARLIERLSEARTAVGQPKAIAMPLPVAGALEHGHSVFDHRLQGN